MTHLIFREVSVSLFCSLFLAIKCFNSKIKYSHDFEKFRAGKIENKEQKGGNDATILQSQKLQN